jgi:hypothetical protein
LKKESFFLKKGQKFFSPRLFHFKNSKKSKRKSSKRRKARAFFRVKMGTNYYWIDDEKTDEAKQDEPEVHIGKRSGAGPFCYPCGISLVEGPSNTIHSGENKVLPCCPRCLRPSPKAALSFTWTMNVHRTRLEDRCGEELLAEKSGESISPCVRDEYGGTFTASQFLSIVGGCVFQFYFYATFS